MLTKCIMDNSVKYNTADDFLPNTKWNKSYGAAFANYILRRPGAEVAFTLEIFYLGEKDNIFSVERAKKIEAALQKL